MSVNAITSTGLTTKSQADLLSDLTTAFQTIYGSDINLDSDSPDGQMINIFIQAAIDNLDLLTDIYNSMNPDTAIGAALDQRVAMNGLIRQGGTFTVTPITIIFSQACTLYGLDQTNVSVYTIQDSSGNNWQLQNTINIPAAGTYILSFQAANPGAVTTIINTITTPVSIVLGVSSVNNPSTYTTLGTNEESDATLRLRRTKSVSLVSTGYQSSLVAALQNISGVTSAFVYENNSSSTNADGVPGHSIWVVMGGSGASTDIANAIYSKRSAGCGMWGAQSANVVQTDGTNFRVYWDVVTYENLYIKVYLTSLDKVNAPNIALIQSQLPLSYVPGVYAEVDINGLGTAIQEIDGNSVSTIVPGASGVFSYSADASGFAYNYLLPSAKDNQFLVESSNIIILPMILKTESGTLTVDPITRNVSSAVTLSRGTSDTMTSLGGYGYPTFGCTGIGGITGATGMQVTYTGPTGISGSAIVTTTDIQGNTAYCTVTVS